MMILGMSSVSFGKSYLCIGDIEKRIVRYPSDIGTGEWEDKDRSNQKLPKFILKTSEKGLISSFKLFGSKSDHCDENIPENKPLLGNLRNFESQNIQYCDFQKGSSKNSIVVNLDSGHFFLSWLLEGRDSWLFYGKCEEI